MSGAARSGATAILSLLSLDTRVACPRSFPSVGYYLLSCLKLSALLARPDLFQFLNAVHLFDFAHLGFDGEPPPYNYVPEVNPANYLPRGSGEAWLKILWSYFSNNLSQHRPDCGFYVERAPYWLAPHVRRSVPCFTIYCFRDPRDILISANALVAKQGSGIPRSGWSGNTEEERARGLALGFARVFENYYADRNRSDILMVRYEDVVLDPTALARRLLKVIGITIGTAGSTALNSEVNHPIPQDRVRRWRREPLARHTADFIVSNLREEMSHLGYETPECAIPGTRFLSFSRDGIDLSSIRTRQGKLEAHADFAIVRVQGRDFHLFLPFAPFEAGEVKNIWVSVNTDLGEVCSIYWRGPKTKFCEERVIYAPLKPSPHWTVVSFVVQAHPQWKGLIAELRLDLFNMVTRCSKRQQPYPSQHGTGRIRWVKLVG